MDATPNEDVIRRIRKLLALSESSNPNEAANAAAKARKMLLEHNLSMEALGEAPGEVDRHEWRKGLRRSDVACSLATAAAKVHLCDMLASSQGTWLIVGRPGNVEAARALLDYLFESMDRSSKRASKGKGLAWANDYRVGWVSVVQRRLRELEVQETCEERALVIREDHAVREFIEKNYGEGFKPKRRALQESEAVLAGIADGKKISLSRQIPTAEKANKPLCFQGV